MSGRDSKGISQLPLFYKVKSAALGVDPLTIPGQEQNIKTRNCVGVMSPVISVYLISPPLLALKGLTACIYQQILA